MDARLDPWPATVHAPSGGDEGGAIDWWATAHELEPLIVGAEGRPDVETQSPAVVLELAARGLFWMCLPRALGGRDADVLSFMTVVEEVARADGSTGWALMANAIQNMFAAAYCDDDAVRQLFGSTSKAIIAGMLAPCGPAIRGEGGFTVSGALKFGSGIGHADWVSGGALYQDAASGTAEQICYVVPADRAEIARESWDVMGLMGTGSYDYTVPSQFVADGFVYRRSGEPPRRGNATLRLGIKALGASGHCAVALGIGKRALEELVRIVDGGRSRPNAVAVRDQQLFRRDFAAHDGELRAARAYAWEAYGEGLAALEREGALPDEQEQRIRQATTLATEAAHRTVEFAYRWAGSVAMAMTHPLNRCLRDILGAVQHISVDQSSLVDAAPALMASYRTR